MTMCETDIALGRPLSFVKIFLKLYFNFSDIDTVITCLSDLVSVQ